MKKIYSSLGKSLLVATAVLCAAPAMQAQTLKVHCGQVSTAFSAADTGDMVFAEGGTRLTIQGITFAVADIDSITTSQAEVQPLSVDVNYATDGKALVQVSADVAQMLSVTASAADVRVLGADGLKQEVNYTLHGTSADGSFYMDGPYKSTLTLDNLNLTSQHGAAIQIDCGKRINVHVPDGTTTTLADAAGGTHKACFFINGHAEFKGAGTLNIAGATKHAYASDEYTWLKPSFGTLNVTAAVSDGMHIEQYFRMDGGQVHISGTQGDCIDVGITKDPTDELNGQALVNAGTLQLTVGADDTKGLKTDSLCTIAGGTLTVDVNGDGAKGLSAGTDLVVSQKTSTPTRIKMNVAGTTYHKDEPDEAKCRGIKVQGQFTFDGGDINMTVTGKKAKGIVVGSYKYVSGTTNVVPET